MDVLSLLYEGIFFILFALAVIAYWQRPAPLTLDLALLFGTLAGFLATRDVIDAWPGAPAAVHQLGLLLVLAQPPLAMRLTRHLRRLPRWVGPALIAGYLVCAVIVVSLGTGDRAWLAVIAAYFVIIDGAAAVRFVLESRHRARLARWRLIVAAIATGLLPVALIFAAVIPDAGSTLARGAALAAGSAFLLAFLPPRWMRRIGQQAVAYRFVTDLSAIGPGTGAARMWEHLAESARGLTGALSSEVQLGDGRDPSTVAVSGEPQPEAPARVVRFERGRRRGELRLWTRGYSLFAEDDLALLAVLGGETLAAAAREDLLRERSALADRVAATNVELARASAAKSDFLASMSHELRTPLNAIIGFSELLMTPPGDAPLEPDDVREYADHIHGAGLHLLGLINDILDLSRVEAGRLDLRHEHVDVARLVVETLGTLRPLAEARGLTLESHVGAVEAEVDAARLRQVIYNLASNAIKFTPAGGRISVALERDGDSMRLLVSDTGPGIAAADQARVFEAFEQLSPGAVEGTGLGLALTRRLVDAHGGSIRLHSAPGEGSSFTVLMPLKRPIAAEPSAVETDEGTAPLVLIIEDDAGAAELLRLQLRQAGYRAAVAFDGEGGLDAARTLRPAAILLDILLPGVDGWEILKQLRDDAETSAIPVMVITVVDDAAWGMALGAVDYFVKPVPRDDLLAALGRLSLTTKVQQRAVTVLAVDDDEAALALYRGALAPEGFRVLEAATGADGLALARSHAIDIIVLDIMLPDLDGFEVAARLKADPVTAGIPIVVVTGRELTEDDKRRLNDHVLDVVTKGDDAVARLRRWLDRVNGQAAA